MRETKVMKLVIFDCDGTLVDSQHMIVSAMTNAFAASALAPPPRSEILSVVGLSLEGAVARLLPKDLRHKAAAMADDYKSAFGELRRQGEFHEVLYPGISETLRMLSVRGDVALAIATGKSRRGVAALLEREGLAHHFSSVQTADDHPSKPHPSMIFQAITDTGVKASDAIMVGDTTFDIEMAAAAGVVPLGVAWGYHPQASLYEAGAKRVVQDSLALSGILENWLQTNWA